ncbi:MAG: hypothetical protein JSS72_08660 [Armatimonadetes bacterium]|nr:hypothetical protein [Armatimonadota bacterium]
MEYFVTGSDGQQYGPVTTDVLRQWAQENRLTPQSLLKDVASGETMAASAIPGLFPTPTASSRTVQPPAATYPRFDTSSAVKTWEQHDMGIIVGVIIRSLLGLIFFFVFKGIGLLFAGYALYYAIQTRITGHPKSWIALIIAVVSFAVIAIGWMLRMSESGTV